MFEERPIYSSMAKAKPKIIIVDDDDMMRETYVTKFQESGFEVTGAKDGLEALELISKETPDVVFTGIIMPRMSGFDLIENIRKNVKTGRLPVIISSHLGRKEDLEKARELGALDFIIKDEVTLDDAVERVKRVLGQRFIYQIAIDKTKYDAHAFAEALGLDPTLTCRHCEGELILSIEYFPKDRHFTISGVCSSCGKINSKS